MKKSRKRVGRKIVQSKKIVIDGITFRSTLEGRMYQLLKEAGIKAKYEGKTYTTFKAITYEGDCYERAQRRSKDMAYRRGVSPVRYTPDFIGEDEEWFIEVKGRANESFPLRWKLFKKMLQDDGKSPMLFKPTTVKDCKQVIQILIDKGYGK